MSPVDRERELCDFIPTPEMRGEAPVACPRCGAEFADDGPITYSGCLSCEPEAAKAAGARPACPSPDETAAASQHDCAENDGETTACEGEVRARTDGRLLCEHHAAPDETGSQ